TGCFLVAASTNAETSWICVQFIFFSTTSWPLKSSVIAEMQSAAETFSSLKLGPPSCPNLFSAPKPAARASASAWDWPQEGLWACGAATAWPGRPAGAPGPDERFDAHTPAADARTATATAKKTARRVRGDKQQHDTDNLPRRLPRRPAGERRGRHDGDCAKL